MATGRIERLTGSHPLCLGASAHGLPGPGAPRGLLREHRRQGSITKAGNSYARRALIEAAWAYRHPARVTRIIATRQTGLPKAACDIAWRAQLRLSAKYRRLAARHLNHNKIVVALARELSGFVWAIGQSVKPL